MLVSWWVPQRTCFPALIEPGTLPSWDMCFSCRKCPQTTKQVKPSQRIVSLCMNTGTLGSPGGGPLLVACQEGSNEHLRPDFVPEGAPCVQSSFLTVALALPGGLWGTHPAPKSWCECPTSLLPGQVTVNRALTFFGPDPTSVSCPDEGLAMAFHQGSAGPPLPKEAAGWGAWCPARQGRGDSILWGFDCSLFSVLGEGAFPGI